jgi:hypothetical protein
MYFVKNMSSRHRLIRLLLAALGVGALFAGGAGRELMWPLGIGLVALAATGTIGWCPMCAMLDRGAPKP